MPLRDEDIAIRSERDSSRLIEVVRSRSGDARGTECHQNFPGWGKLEHLMTLALFALDVGDPHISIRVDGDAVRHYHQPAAEIVQ